MTKKVEKANVETVNLGKAVAKFKNVTPEETVNLAGEKIIREWELRIRTAKGNIEKAIANYNQDQIEIDQELAERKQSYDNSYLNVDEVDVKTVELRKSFVAKYEKNIANALKYVEEFERAIALRDLTHSTYIKEQEEIVTLYENRIAKFYEMIGG